MNVFFMDIIRSKSCLTFVSGICVVVFLCCTEWLSAQSPQYITDSLLTSDGYRTFVLHLPPAYNLGKPLPLMLAFHGGGGVGWQSIAFQSQLTPTSDSAGFILVYPEGKSFSGSQYVGWNAGFCCPPSSMRNVDDVAFVDALLNLLIKRYRVDTTRIYAVGSSNGGMLALRLACSLGHRLAAIGVNAASHVHFPCAPSRPIPIINFHSRKDSNVVYTGGFGPNSVAKVPYPSQDSLLNLWQRFNKCTVRDTVRNGRDTGYTFIKLRQCSSGVEIHHYATSDGGHSWAGGPPKPDEDVSQQIQATTLLWDFLRQFTSNNAAITSVFQPDATPASALFDVSPNPISDEATIRILFSEQTVIRLSMYDIFGREMLRICEGEQSAGHHEYTFSAQRLPQSAYFLRLQTLSLCYTKPIQVLR